MMNGMRKGLPSRPSQGVGFSASTSSTGQNRGQDVYENRPPPSNERNMESQSRGPAGAVILGGYRNDIISGFEGEKPRYNPMNTTRPQSSMLLNVNDPIQVHLLVETALGDSKEFEILSQEEVDSLKKQVQSLTQRLEQTRQNLTIQSKYRDAAISMAKLYSPSRNSKGSDASDAKKPRRSLLGHKSSNSMQEADAERLASERKCEELAAELWSLEKRLIEPQHRLLKHTAGILQMTHKGPRKTTNGVQEGGIPGSPESMYTYSNARSSMEPLNDELFFDERSLYRTAEHLDTFGPYGAKDNPELPQKSQSREQPQVIAKTEQMQMIAKTEQKLEDLNSRLREVIVKANPERGAGYGLPPLARTNVDGRPATAGETLQSHLDYLEKSIATIDLEHGQSARKQQQVDKRKQDAERRMQESEIRMEETIKGLNQNVWNLLLRYDENRPEPPQPSGEGLQQQLAYFQDIIGAVGKELSRAESKTNGSSDNQGAIEQMEAVLMGLWDIIHSGEDEIRKRKQERRMTRSAEGLPDDDEDLSADDFGDPDEPFSLQAFSTKVQLLYSQATRLKDQKKVLQRQIKQQRELNNKSDATKDTEIAQKAEELEKTKSLLTKTEMNADSVREQLSVVMGKLDEARQQERLRDQSRANDESAAVRAAQDELDQRNEAISALEDELRELKDDNLISNAEFQGQMAESEAKIASLTTKLEDATSAQASQEALLKEKEKEVEAKEKEIDDINMDLARLQTEVTIARAELDGAYGSRAQRAAQVASNPAIQKEIDGLTKKNASLTAEIAQLKEKGQGGKEGDENVKTLKKELQETIEEYELMTKASIEWEKEREQLESTIDKLRNDREGLEAQLSDEKVRWLGMKSPGADGTSPGMANTSTTVLKNEFKKMMRDTRAENQKALRAEQTERRRVEDELRSLKKLQGPGKSLLSQRA